MLTIFLVFGLSDAQINTDSNETLARQYIKSYSQLKTKEQRYQAVLNSLLELAVCVDTAATKNEIEYLISSEVNDVLNVIEKKDKDMKAKFEDLEVEVDKYKSEVHELVQGVITELKTSMKSVRKNLFQNVRREVLESFDENRLVGEKVQRKAEKSLNSYTSHSTNESIAFFIGFQVLILLLIYFYCKYIQQVHI